jgi:hypothetical protein
MHLRALARGEEQDLCRFRAEDEFHELAELVNEVVRKSAADKDGADEQRRPPLRAAG